jgi:type IV pilus assembly protein PilY1
MNGLLKRCLTTVLGMVGLIWVAFAWAADWAPPAKGVLSKVPLDTVSSVAPVTMIAFSDEYPTMITYAYHGKSFSFSPSQRYEGYFDPDKCYQWNATDEYFEPVSHSSLGVSCDAAPTGAGQKPEYSGNMLNYATMMTVDGFRWGMTGGSRLVDTPGETVLRRAFVSTQAPYAFYDSLSSNLYPRWLKTGNGDIFLTATMPYSGFKSSFLHLKNKAYVFCSNPQLVVSTRTSNGTNTIGGVSYYLYNGGSYNPPSLTCNRTTNSSTAAPSWWSPGYNKKDYQPGTGTPPGTYTPLGSTQTVVIDMDGACTWGGDGLSEKMRCKELWKNHDQQYLLPSNREYITSGGNTPGHCITNQAVASHGRYCSSSANDSNNAIFAYIDDNSLGHVDDTMTITVKTVSHSFSNVQATCTSSTSGTNTNSMPWSWGSTTDMVVGYPKYQLGSVGVEPNNSSSSTGGPATLGTIWPGSIGGAQCTTATVTGYYVQNVNTRNDTFTYRAITEVYWEQHDADLTVPIKVKACSGPRPLAENCQQYGSSYKPTGVLHDYADIMRFGLVSYFRQADQFNLQTDNAVVRAKVKWMGERNANDDSINPNPEWSLTDGTFFAKPESGASYTGFTHSGLMNYLNYNPEPSERKPVTTRDPGGVDEALHPEYNPNYYKRGDNINKLYAESLKYLKAKDSSGAQLSATNAYYSAATADFADNFPIFTTWEDPYENFWCRKANIVLIGDRNNWCDKKVPNMPAYGSDGNPNPPCSPADNTAMVDGWAPDFGLYTDKASTALGSNQPKTQVIGIGNSSSYALVGMAFWANSQDVREDLTQVGGRTRKTTGGEDVKATVTTYIIDVQEYNDCGYQGKFWNAAKMGGARGFDKNNVPIGWSELRLATGAPCVTNPPPVALNDPAGRLELWPRTLYPGGDPGKFKASLTAVLESINANSPYITPLSAASSNLQTTNYAYVSSFTASPWSGDVMLYTFDSSGNLAATPTWKASEKIPDHNARTILTWHRDQNRGVAFRQGVLSGHVFDQLKDIPSSSDASQVSIASQRLLWIRGDRSYEASGQGTGTYDQLRTRKIKVPPSGTTGGTSGGGGSYVETDALIGDILGSVPVYVGDTETTNIMRGLSGYNDFLASARVTRRNNNPMIYVGANDGMLHGFSAETASSVTAGGGVEKIAYVPEAVGHNLKAITEQFYDHVFTVDGPVSVSDACMITETSSTVCSASDWKTVLAGTLRAGGRGVYALDVTDPTNFSEGSASDIVLWEFNAFDDKDLGFTPTRPLIRRFRNGRWGVIVGNGWNNTTIVPFASSSDPNKKMEASTTGRAYIYILWLPGPGVGNNWGNPCSLLRSGTNCSGSERYVKIELSTVYANGNESVKYPNGIVQIMAHDIGRDGSVDFLYAGDIYGNVWKIDVRPDDYRLWGMPKKETVSGGVTSYIARGEWGTLSAPIPLFTAQTADGKAQPISSAIQVTAHPNGGYMVMFGTGSWAFKSDRRDKTTQSIYGIWDQSGVRDGLGSRQFFPVARNTLQKQRFLTSADYGGQTYGVVSNCVPYYGLTAAPSGFTTAQDGSSASDSSCPDVVSAPTTQYGWVLDLHKNERMVSDTIPLQYGVATFVTTMQVSDAECETGTEGWEYHLNYLTGGRPNYAVFTTSASSTTPLLFNPGSGGVATSVAPNAVKLPVGQTSATLRVNEKNIAGKAGSGGGSDTTAGESFVPGWGVPGRMAIGACNRYLEVGKTASQGLCLRGLRGRVSWRQIQGAN